MTPLVLVNAVGLTPRWLPHAPRLLRLAVQGWVQPLREVLPAVTCTAQASILTGKLPHEHGIVANGWLFRDTMEVRFWQQSNRLLQAPPIYQTLREKLSAQGKTFRCAKLFWWFNQGADVDFAVTPKPYYGADGNKVFGIQSRPVSLAERLERKLGPFPFQTFWGPMAGLPCTQWIARCAADVVQELRPDLTLVYLPHLDYDPQRSGPSGVDMVKQVQQLDDACAPLLETVQSVGAEMWIVSEYAHCDVRTPVYLNRELRRAGLLAVRDGPFGENLETHESAAFAVCDHQLAHVYLNDVAQRDKVRHAIPSIVGVDRVFEGEARSEIGLHHDRAGDFVLLAKPDAWFAYPFWLDDRRAPDYARCIDIHRKPGFDPCEMFFDPKLWWPKGRALCRLVQKKLGFRTLFDVVPLDATLVRGSHGLAAVDPLDRPLFIGTSPVPTTAQPTLTVIHELLAQRFGLS